jgi:5S rRNA maturation endonuclease (ribonuclease M5)
MKQRSHSLETLKAFRVGFTDGRLYEFLSSQGFSSEQLKDSGLVKEKDGRLEDFFQANLYIYPHLTIAGRIGHFTIKDPQKRLSYQLPNEYRDPGCLFFNMPAFKGKQIVLVEGENDLLSVCGRGGHGGVVACIGQLSQAQIESLAKWASGKTIYTCFDTDPAGQKYHEKLEAALQSHLLSPELARVTGRKSIVLKRFALTGVKDIDEFLQSANDPKAALAVLFERSMRCLMPLKKNLALYKSLCEEQGGKPSSTIQGELIFDFFNQVGKYFIDGDACFLYDGARIYQIGNGVAFRAMMYTRTGIHYAHNAAKAIWEVVQVRAYERGDHATVPGWIYTDRTEPAVWFNLNNPGNEVIRLSPGQIELVQNGLNPERILLRDSPNMQAIRFLPDADVAQGMNQLKKLIFNNLTCSPSNRFFILVRIFNTLMIQFTKARGLDKFSGSKGSGKTAAAALVSAFIYGQDQVTSGSAASNFSEATISPLIIEDNLETEAIRGAKRDFLLLAATGATKQKRKSGTDGQNVYERLCSQVIVTAIEPFLDAELTERTTDIGFSKEFFSPEYLEAKELEAHISKERDLIWSSLFKIMAHQVMPGFTEKRAVAIKMLRERYPGHAKSRLNELYSCLYLLLEKILKYIPHPEYSRDPFKEKRQAEAILEDWVAYQERQAKAAALGTNPILHRLEILVREFLAGSREFGTVYNIGAVDSRNEWGEPVSVELEASTRELFICFEVLAKTRGIACPYTSPSQLGARLHDSLDVLSAAGWEFRPRIKIVRGNKRHAFTRTF